MEDNENKAFIETLKQLFYQTENIIDNIIPLEPEINFDISDIFGANYIYQLKNDPKICFQKFKMRFVRFFKMEDYFFGKQENIIKEDTNEENTSKEFIYEENVNKDSKIKGHINKEKIETINLI